MTLGQMNSKLMKAQEAETHLDRALICRALLEEIGRASCRERV